MKSGYDQFFKKARKIANGDSLEKDQRNGRGVSFNLNSNVTTSADSKLKKKNLKKKRITIPWKLVGGTFIGLILALYGYQNHVQVENLIKNIEVGILTGAWAEETTAAPATAENKNIDPKMPINQETPGESVKVASNSESVESTNYLKKLEERKNQLDAREQELNRIEKELQEQRNEIEKKLSELTQMRQEISSSLDDRVKIDDQKVDVLVQVYSTMKPPQAAKVFESMDEDLAVEILGRMKKKSAADIMNLMKAEKAQAISEKYAGYKRKPASSPTSTSQSKETVNK